MDQNAATYTVAIKSKESPRTKEHKKQLKKTGSIKYDHKKDETHSDDPTPSIHQLHDMVNEVKQVMKGLSQMQAAMNHFHSRQLQIEINSNVSTNSSSTTSNTDTTSTTTKTTTTTTKTDEENKKVSSQDEEHKQVSSQESTPRKKTAFEKNLVMLNLRATLKKRGKSARKRLHSMGSRHLQMASQHHKIKSDNIDMAIMQNKQLTTTSSSNSEHSSKYQKNTEESKHNDNVKTVKKKLTRRLSVGTLSVASKVKKKRNSMKSLDNSTDSSMFFGGEDPKKPSFCERTIIHPFNAWHTAWDCAVCVVLMVVLWYMPLTLAFDEISENSVGLSLLIDIVFGIDMIKQFRTGYITVEDEIVVMDPWTVAMKYLKSWFLADFVSCMPIDVIVISIMSMNAGVSANGSVENDVGVQTALRGTKSLKMLRLIRIAKLVRLMRVSRAFRYIRFAKSIVEDKLKIEIPNSSIKLFRLLMGVVLVCHWGACINYFICKLYSFPPESWIALGGVQHLPMKKKYGWCFLKAAGAFVNVGFGTTPLSSTQCSTTSEWCEVETWITFLQLFIGQIYYAILVAEISTIIHSMDIAKSAFEDRMNATNGYMRSKKLPSELRDKIRDYMRARYKDGRMVDEPAVLSSLSPALKREVMACCAKELAEKVPWLRNDVVLHSRVSEIAEPRFALDGDVLLREGELGHTVFIISQGVIELFKTYNNGWEESEPQLIRAIGGKISIYVPHIQFDQYYILGIDQKNTDNSKIFFFFSFSSLLFLPFLDGCTFGAVSVVLDVRCSATAIAKGNVMLYAIPKVQFKKMLMEFESTSSYWRKLAILRKKRSDKADDDEEGVDPEDAQTELFQLSMQLSRAENGNFMEKMKEDSSKY